MKICILIIMIVITDNTATFFSLSDVVKVSVPSGREGLVGYNTRF